jgi:hypothetical protein
MKIYENSENFRESFREKCKIFVFLPNIALLGKLLMVFYKQKNTVGVTVLIN